MFELELWDDESEDYDVLQDQISSDAIGRLESA